MTTTNPRRQRHALVTRWFRSLRGVVMAMAIVTLGFIGTTAISGTAGAAQFAFHLHVDAYSVTNNCEDWDWTTSGYGRCTAQPGLRGFPANGLGGNMIVRWCTAPTNCTDVGTRTLPLPAGDSRWMVVCLRIGQTSCDPGNWLVGAVRGVNGPFTVMEGRYDNHLVNRSGTGAVESQGGPLFLYVGYAGRVALGSGHFAKGGYVFGLRGQLDVS
jgi:hypothetical protein